MEKATNKSLIEQLSSLTANNEKQRKENLEWLKKNASFVIGIPHSPMRELSEYHDVLDFEQPHGRLREWLRIISLGRLRL